MKILYYIAIVALPLFIGFCWEWARVAHKRRINRHYREYKEKTTNKTKDNA
jgi:hypothetical protein